MCCLKYSTKFGASLAENEATQNFSFKSLSRLGSAIVFMNEHLIMLVTFGLIPEHISFVSKTTLPLAMVSAVNGDWVLIHLI